MTTYGIDAQAVLHWPEEDRVVVQLGNKVMGLQAMVPYASIVEEAERIPWWLRRWAQWTQDRDLVEEHIARASRGMRGFHEVRLSLMLVLTEEEAGSVQVLVKGPGLEREAAPRIVELGP